MNVTSLWGCPAKSPASVMEKISRAHLKVISRNDIIWTNGHDDIIKGEGPKWGTTADHRGKGGNLKSSFLRLKVWFIKNVEMLQLATITFQQQVQLNIDCNHISQGQVRVHRCSNVFAKLKKRKKKKKNFSCKQTFWSRTNQEIKVTNKQTNKTWWHYISTNTLNCSYMLSIALWIISNFSSQYKAGVALASIWSPALSGVH